VVDVPISRWISFSILSSLLDNVSGISAAQIPVCFLKNSSFEGLLDTCESDDDPFSLFFINRHISHTIAITIDV